MIVSPRRAAAVVHAGRVAAPAHGPDRPAPTDRCTTRPRLDAHTARAGA